MVGHKDTKYMRTAIFFEQNSAMLVQGKIESKYRTLEDLQNCQVDPRSVCVPEGGAMGTFWKKVVASQYVVASTKVNRS